MPTLDVGDGSTAAADFIQLSIRPGDTVVVNNLAASGSAVNVFQNGFDASPTSVAVNSNVSISTAGPVWVQAQSGIASVQVTGGIYGAV